MQFSTFIEVVRRQAIIVVSVLVIGFLAFLLLLPVLKSYSATATVLASTASQQSSAILDPTKDPTTGGIDAADLSTVLVGSVIMNRVASDLHLSEKERGRLPKRFKTKVTVGSGLLPITFTDRDPVVAVEGANFAARELARFDQQVSTTRYDGLLRDIAAQLSSLHSKLSALDQKIAELTTNDALLVDDQGRTGLTTRIIALEQDRDRLEESLHGDTSAASSADERPLLSRDLASAEIVKMDPMVDQIKQQYGKDLAQENVLGAGYTDNFPGLQAARQLVSSEGKSLRSEIASLTSNPDQSATYVSTLLEVNKAHSAVQQDAAQLSIVVAQLSGLKRHLLESAGSNTRLATLRTERNGLEDSYHQLLLSQAHTEADRAQAASIDTVIVIDSAVEASRSLLSRPAVLALAVLVISVWVAVSLAFLVDSNDRRLRTRESIEELYGKPVYQPVG